MGKETASPSETNFSSLKVTETQTDRTVIF